MSLIASLNRSEVLLVRERGQYLPQFIENQQYAREGAKSWECGWPRAHGLVWKRDKYDRDVPSSLLSCMEEHLSGLCSVRCEVCGGSFSFPSIPSLPPVRVPHPQDITVVVGVHHGRIGWGLSGHRAQTEASPSLDSQ